MSMLGITTRKKLLFFEVLNTLFSPHFHAMA
jgi:hypothetical protein